MFYHRRPESYFAVILKSLCHHSPERESRKRERDCGGGRNKLQYKEKKEDGSLTSSVLHLAPSALLCDQRAHSHSSYQLYITRSFIPQIHTHTHFKHEIAMKIPYISHSHTYNHDNTYTFYTTHETTFYTDTTRILPLHTLKNSYKKLKQNWTQSSTYMTAVCPHS